MILPGCLPLPGFWTELAAVLPTDLHLPPFVCTLPVLFVLLPDFVTIGSVSYPFPHVLRSLYFSFWTRIPLDSPTPAHPVTITFRHSMFFTVTRCRCTHLVCCLRTHTTPGFWLPFGFRTFCLQHTACGSGFCLDALLQPRCTVPAGFAQLVAHAAHYHTAVSLCQFSCPPAVLLAAGPPSVTATMFAVSANIQTPLP